VSILREKFPEIRVRVVNAVDPMTLQPMSEHPHGLADRDFDAIFTGDKPSTFASHGYPWLNHLLTYRRTNHDDLHAGGYEEVETTTAPFDIVVRNDLDRFQLVEEAIDRVPLPGPVAADAKQAIRDELIEHAEYIREHGKDLPEIRNWNWKRGVVERGGTRALSSLLESRRVR